VRLYLHAWGDTGSPPVVCLHGVTTHGMRFAHLAERLPGFRVVAPDLRGHGRSGWEPPWRIETHLDDVLETLDGIGVERAAWVGHSFGGRLVLELAARRPDRVDRAVLLDPAIHVRPDLALAAAESVRPDRVYASPADAVPVGLAGGLFSTPPELIEEERTQHLEAVDGGFRWRYCRSAAVTILGELAVAPPLLEQIRAPMLLVVGSEATVVGTRQVDELRHALGSGLEVVSVPGGHVVLWDAFDEAAAAVKTFLEAA
jgi:lipase